MSVSRRRSYCMVGTMLFSLICVPHWGQARYRTDDSALFLSEVQAGHVDLSGQGTFFTIGADTSHMEAAASLRVGLGSKFCFEFSYPYLSQSQGAFSKSGQGDLLTAISYHQALGLWPALHVGFREALIFPSGFRQELAGFDEFTTGRAQWESLLQLEQGGGESAVIPVTLALNLGLRTDSHRENNKFLWGAAFRYQAIRHWLALETELAQEMDTRTKESDFQFSAGGEISLPLGFDIRVGAQERVMYNLDRFGVYAALNWSHQPVVPVRIQHRRLRPQLQSRLDAKNQVPAFTLEPGAPPMLAEAGRLPFLPLKVLVLPFAEYATSPVAQRLAQQLLRTIQTDTLFSLVSQAELDQALHSMHMKLEQVRTEKAVNELGRLAGADLVLRGQVLDYKPRMRKGFSLPPLVASSRQAVMLTAQIWLHAMDQSTAPSTSVITAEFAGPSNWIFLRADHGVREPVEDALLRSRITQVNLENWCQRASDALLYEITEQLVVDK